MDALPIDPLVPEIVELLARLRPSGSLVLEAPPGAGKTTRVPFAVTSAPWCTGQVLVTEPRRIAARLSAARVAEERGLRLGHEVGYRVRFDDRARADSRLVYVTEGLLLRRLLEDPDLRGTSAVFFDEVHEQSAELEAAIALLTRRVEDGLPLRLVAMSATLNGEKLSAYWRGAPRVTSAGRSYEVRVEHAPAPDDRPLEIQVRSAVRAELAREGDILVFLPGAREIRLANDALGQLPGIEVVTLHGDLPLEAQSRVVRGGGGTKRVILSTNVAESSLTIPSVTTVVDSGLGRVARHDPWSGMTRLEVEEICRARAVQRAGRAGRTAPGVARRLFTAQNFAARPAEDTPELHRVDTSDLLLLLRAAAIDERDVRWLSEPPRAHFETALGELRELGALGGDGTITPVGRRMLDFPLPVRLARVLVEAELLGVAEDGALAVALLAERDVLKSGMAFGDRREARTATHDSDLEDRMAKFEEARLSNFDARTLRDLDLDASRVQAVSSARKQLLGLLDRKPSKLDLSVALTRALLRGYHDRVAERRGNGSDVVLASGATARLDESSGVHRAPLFLALSVDAPFGRQRSAVVRLAHAIDRDLLFDVEGDRFVARETYSWSEEKERVEEESTLSYGSLTLDRSRRRASPGPDAARVLLRVAQSKGSLVFDPDARIEALGVRLALAAAHVPELFPEDDESRRALVEGARSPGKLLSLALEHATSRVTSSEELRALDLPNELLADQPHEFLRALDEATPRDCTLPGGLRVPIHYEVGRPPWIEARLQNFFSVKTTPSICRGRLPLQVHLLAPNHRAVQVTTDLAGFWTRHYPTLRKELMRRYPKHLWPEEGSTAAPPTPGKIR